MWIKRRDYEKLVSRVDELEREVWCPQTFNKERLGRTVGMVMEHLGLTLDKPLPYAKLVKKGGPERV